MDSSDEIVYLQHKKNTYKGRIVFEGDTIGILDMEDSNISDEVYTPSGFCSKYLHYNCNGWTKLYVIRDGAPVILNRLRKGNASSSRKKQTTTNKKTKNTKKNTEKGESSGKKRTPSPLVEMTPPPPPDSSSLSDSPSKSPSPLPLPKNNISNTKGAAIVLWYKDATNKAPMILVGKESKYVSDIYPEVEEHQVALFDEKDVEKAKMYFFKKTRDLENAFGIARIQYDDPKQITNQSFHVNYRFLADKSKRGIIKGQVEEGETHIQAIVREVAEELGVNIHEKMQQIIQDVGICDGYAAFSLELPERDIHFFKKRIEERIVKKRGEMFELSFEPLSAVLSDIRAFNYKSSCIIKQFYKTQL